MGASGSKSVAVTSYDTLKFSWWENSQSVVDNATKVGWKLELIAGSYGRIDASAARPWSVTVNGEKYDGTASVGIGNNETKTLASGETTIAHGSNGKKTFSYSFSQSFSGITFSETALGTVSGNGNGTLTDIARGLLFRGNGSSFDAFQFFTGNGSGWDHIILYIGNGSGWDMCN